MRTFLFAVLLVSCTGDPAHRTPSPIRHEPPVVVAASVRAAPAAPVAPPRSEPVPVAVAAAEPPAPLPDPRLETRRAAHDVLADNCGECHEGHRSSKPKALAVFDLDLPDWPTRFDTHRFASALGRLTKKSESASKVFIAFRDAELAARR